MYTCLSATAISSKPMYHIPLMSGQLNLRECANSRMTFTLFHNRYTFLATTTFVPVLHKSRTQLLCRYAHRSLLRTKWMSSCCMTSHCLHSNCCTIIASYIGLDPTGTQRKLLNVLSLFSQDGSCTWHNKD